MLDALVDWLKSTPGLIATLGVIFTLLMNSFVKFWKKALIFRKDVVSREDLDDFKKSVRSDLRYYKEEISDIVIKSTFKIIDEKLSILEDFKKSFVDIEKLKIEIMHEIDNLKVNIDSIDVLKDNMRTIQNTVNRVTSVKEKKVERDIDKR